LTCSDSSHRLSVKRGAKLMSKSSKPTSDTVATPLKAAVAAPNAKNDEVHRRRNPFNDMLRHRNMGLVGNARHDGPLSLGHEPSNAAPQPQPSEDSIDVRMAHRVAELESALAVAKDEQDALRNDLVEVREQRRTDQDAIQDLERRLGPPHRSASQTPSRASSGHWKDSEDDADEDVVRQNHELCHKLAQPQEGLARGDALHHNHLERPSSEETEHLRLRLHTAEKESQERLQQLLSLKSSISSLTRADPQVTDGELVDSFTQLANRIREWTISNFRRTKMELSDVSKETSTILRSIAPDFENLAATDRLAFFQAIIAQALMQIFQEPLIVGVPLAHQLPSQLVGIRSFTEEFQDPMSAEFSEWRRATIRLLERSEALKDLLEYTKDSLLHRVAGEIRQLLWTLTAVIITTDAHGRLLGIVSTVIELQRTLALQRANYEVLFFRNGDTRLDFEDQTMETINDLEDIVNDDSVMGVDRTFLFCVFPGLLKFGDEWGQHHELSNVLLKARVCSDGG
jgi:hypothetical protein